MGWKQTENAGSVNWFIPGTYQLAKVQLEQCILIVCHFQTRLGGGGGPAPQGGAAKTVSGALAGSESEMRERVVPLGRLQEEPRDYDYNRAATLQQVLFP